MQILEDGVGQVPDGVACATTIGVYDGIHRGHQAVLAQLRSHAEERQLAVAVVTFDVHPALVLRPENAPLLLTSHEQRLELFEAQGVEYLYLIEFDEQRATTPAEGFVTDVLVGALNTRMVTVGEDFHFGKGRTGNVDMLTTAGAEHGFDVVGLDLLTDPGWTEPVSSTAIRRALAGGDVTRAAEMLGRRFQIRGEVSTGDQRGRLLGFPTANVATAPGAAVPADGVYAAWCVLPDGTRHPTAVNIGRRPTFHQHAEQSLLEAHLIGFSGDLYGQRVQIEFERFLRSEQRFDGVEAIKAQLDLDIASVSEILSA